MAKKNNESAIHFNADDLQSLYQYAMVLCQHPENAQDFLQSSIEATLSDIQHGKHIDKPLDYARRIIRNRFIDRYRHDKRWQTDTFEEQADYDISPVDTEQLHVNQQTLTNIWATLAPKDRDILYHWAVLGYTTDEACQLLDMPRGTFLSRIHRLRKQCTNLIDAEVKDNRRELKS